MHNISAIYIYIYIYICVCVCVCVCVNVCINAYKQYIYIYIYMKLCTNELLLAYLHIIIYTYTESTESPRLLELSNDKCAQDLKGL